MAARRDAIEELRELGRDKRSQVRMAESVLGGEVAL